MSVTFDDVVTSAISMINNSADRKELISALYNYGAYGEDSCFTNDHMKVIFYLLKNRIDLGLD